MSLLSYPWPIRCPASYPAHPRDSNSPNWPVEEFVHGLGIMHDNILAISLCERHKFCNCLCLRPGRGVTVSVSVHNLCVYLSPGNKLTAKWQSQLCIQPYKAPSPSLRGSAPYLCKSYLCLEHRRKHGIGSLYRRESTRGELPNDDNSP